MDGLFLPLQARGYCLRSWVNNDAQSLAKYASDRAIWLNMRDEFPHPYGISEAEVFVANANCRADAVHLAVATEQEAVGSISLLIHDDIRRYSGVLSYWISRKYWGQGLATNAITNLSNYAFHQLGLVRVYAKVFSTNIGSIRALEKSGFEREGYFHKGVYKQGRFIDQVLYAKVV